MSNLDTAVSYIGTSTSTSAAGDLAARMLRTAQLDEPINRAVIMAGLGAAGEAGEIADYMKKVFFHAKDFNRHKVIEELGDCAWYAVYMLQTLDNSLLAGLFDSVNAMPFSDYLVNSALPAEEMYIRAGLEIGAAGGRMAQLVNASLDQFGGYHRSFKRLLIEQAITLLDKIRHMGALVMAGLDDIAWANVQKLERRYPNGYNHKDAQARRDQHQAAGSAE